MPKNNAYLAQRDADRAKELAETRLKPCPFCGGAAEMCDHGRITKRQRLPFFRVRCKECGVHRSKYSTTVSAAEELWNERSNTVAEKRGHWIIRSIGNGANAMNWAECSECHVCGNPQWKRCPVCETVMDQGCKVYGEE